MPENFVGTDKRGSDIGAKPEIESEAPVSDTGETYLYDGLEDPRDIVDENWRELDQDKRDKDFLIDENDTFHEGAPAEAKAGMKASEGLVRPEDPASLQKIDEIRREISGNIGEEHGPEPATPKILPDTQREEQTTDSNHKEKGPRIPSSVYERLAKKISKFLNRNADNPGMDSNAVLDIVHGMGVKEDSPIYERIKRQADLLLGMKGRNNRDENRQIARTQKEYQKEVQIERDEERKVKMGSRKAAMNETFYGKNNVSDSVRRNKGDIRWIDDIKDYIKELGDDEEAVASFWKNFEYVYKNRTTKNGEKLDEGDMKRTENGVITEVAAEKLFLGWNDFIAKEAQSENKIRRIEDLANIDFMIEKATPEEDATKKTDFFVSFTYGGENVKIPVQVKSDYFEDGWSKGEDYSEEDVICYYGSKKPREHSRVDAERMKFFAENPVGFYMVLSHGHDGLSISPGGKASRSMESLFNRRMASVLPGLLNKIDNMKMLAEREEE